METSKYNPSLIIKFQPKHKLIHTFSDKQFHITTSQNSLSQIKKISFNSLKSKSRTTSSEIIPNFNTEKKSNNFNIIDGKLLLDPKKIEDFNKYIMKNDKIPLQEYLSFVKHVNPLKIQRKISSDSKILNKNSLFEQCETYYNFAPSYNQYYLDTKSKYKKNCSNIKNKTVLMNSFNAKFKNDGNKSKSDSKKKNLIKLNSLLLIQKEKIIFEKPSIFFDKITDIKKIKNFEKATIEKKTDFNRIMPSKMNLVQTNSENRKITKNSKFGKISNFIKSDKAEKKKNIAFYHNFNKNDISMKFSHNGDSSHCYGDKDDDLDYYLSNNYVKNT